MHKRWVITVIGLSLLALAACKPKTPEATPTINESMIQVMAPHAQTIWDVTSGAFNAKGDGLDPTKLSDGDWAKLAAAGAWMRDRAEILATAKHLTTAGPGEHVMGQEASGVVGQQGADWDAASPKQIQAKIDANPKLFAERARILAQAGDTVAKAAAAKDAQMLYGVSANLDEVCDGCHEKFWGTDQAPPFPKTAAR